MRANRAILANEIYKAQRAIERRLNAAGYKWRDLERVIVRDYGGRWGNIVPAAKTLLSNQNQENN